MIDVNCPACGAEMAHVIGLEDGRIRYRCDLCLNDWLEREQPGLRLCSNPRCVNWVQEPDTRCGSCLLEGEYQSVS
jgi:transposase-like protein